MTSTATHAFGITLQLELPKDKKGHIANSGCCFIEESKLVLPVGRHVAVQDFYSQSMSFLPHPSNVETVLSVACEVKKRNIAVCERVPVDSENAVMAQVSIYKLDSKAAPKRTKTLTHVFDASDSPNDFNHAAFSRDGRLLACCSCGHDPAIVVWDWKSSKRVALSEGDQHKVKQSKNPHS